jgi:diguanylate cyclase (GGDEF)-like protein
MGAVAATRSGRALQRRRPPQGDSQAAPLPMAPVPPVERPMSAQLARGSLLLIAILAAAMIAGAAIGVVLAHASDVRQSAERHVALNRALGEVRAVFGNGDRIDAAALAQIAQASGLNGLRFAAAPPKGGGRDMQPLLNGRGRIVGWFSWRPDRTLIHAADWLAGMLGVVGTALLLGVALAAWATQCLVRLFAGSIETIRNLSSEDPVTGLANQRAIRERLDAVLSGRDWRKPTSERVIFALVDLDGFLEIDESLGHRRAEAVLVTVGERLRAALPGEALLGRFEEDTFAVIASGEGSQNTDALIATLHAGLAGPVVAGQNWQISAGIGIAQAPQDGTTAEELIRRARLALRGAKREARGVVRCFEPRIESERADRRLLVRELGVAIASRAFDIHYQPIVAADGSGIVGVEALLRWMHPTRGEVTPATFIPLAEKHGLMGELGGIVLRRALADAGRWPDLYVAVNLSPIQIRSPDLVDHIGAAIARAGIEPSRIIFEMTEGILIDDPRETQARLKALRALGVGIALDDFGTGYSSLSYLQKFPFQKLKIDRAFVASLGAIGEGAAIVQSIVTLGHALGMSVLAEGIETDEQRVLLRLAGCDEMQGFLFAAPGPAAAIDALLARQDSGRPARGRPLAAAS